MVKLVLFDIDGTLVRTGGAGVFAFARAGELAFGVRDGTRGMNFAGRTDTSLVREFFGRHGLAPTPAHFQQFFERYVFLLDHYLDEHPGRVCPGVPAWLATLARLDPPPLIGLQTGNLRLGAEIKLRHFGLWDAFVTGAFGDDHEDRNQLAVIAHQRGSRLLGTPLCGGEILVVGDTPFDIACGRAIGARVLAVATGGASLAELERHRPDWAVDQLESISVGAVLDGATNRSAVQ
ncbi:MAG: HAD hydrolase-like protein [Verrucomicrobiota bacterium]